MRQIISRFFMEFFQSEKTGGFILIAATIIAILTANSPFGDSYLNFWHHVIGFENKHIHLNYPIEYWVNDGLMAIFFLLVGLEIKRELYVGELSGFKTASLPVFAALGGMLVPAAIHFLLNKGTAAQAGFGIPMATDIAFALAILSLMGNKVPVSLKVFLAAFAIIDDLGAIIIIAIVYTQTISFVYLASAAGIFLLLVVLNKLRVNKLIFYLLPAVVMWYCMLQSGVHATISGVMLALALPLGTDDKNSASRKLQNVLHKPVSFLILPLFALANTGIIITSDWYQHLASKNSLGILVGLVAGKPLGILLVVFLAVKLKISSLNEGLRWKHIIGAALLGGIGFTISIFISVLAFNDEQLIASSKIAVMLASILTGIIGYVYLRLNFQKKANT